MCCPEACLPHLLTSHVTSSVSDSCLLWLCSPPAQVFLCPQILPNFQPISFLLWMRETHLHTVQKNIQQQFSKLMSMDFWGHVSYFFRKYTEQIQWFCFIVCIFSLLTKHGILGCYHYNLHSSTRNTIDLDRHIFWPYSCHSHFEWPTFDCTYMSFSPWRTTFDLTSLSFSPWRTTLTLLLCPSHIARTTFDLTSLSFSYCKNHIWPYFSVIPILWGPHLN